jgi:hypothetical protein
MKAITKNPVRIAIAFPSINTNKKIYIAYSYQK